MLNQKILYVFLFLGVLIFASCEEEPPYINLTPEAVITDTTYVVAAVPAAQQRNILIEEFTGVRCPNCPDAQTEAKTISNNNPGRIHIITIHPLGLLNSLTTPFSKNIGDKHDSKFDMRTEAGKQIFQLIGVTQQLPTGAVNRRLFNGETNIAVDFTKWAAFVNAELNASTPVNINVDAKLTGDSVEVECLLTYTQQTSDSSYLTLALIEEGIVDVQERKLPSGTIVYEEDYEHNHVLRAVITGTLGDLLNPKLSTGYTLEAGRTFKKVYRYKLGSDWNKNNLQVVAYVHGDPAKKVVINAREVQVK